MPSTAKPLPRQGCRGSREGAAAPHRSSMSPDSAFLLSWVSLSKEELSLDALFCPFSHLTDLCRVFLLSFPSRFSLRVQRDHQPPPPRDSTDLHSYKRARPRRVIYFTLSATVVMTGAATAKYKNQQISDTTSFRKSLCS